MLTVSPGKIGIKKSAILGAILVALVILSVSPLQAATFTVNDAGNAADADPGDGVCATAGAVCTLRAAIQEANVLAGADVININPDLGTINVPTELPFISTEMDIIGPRADLLAIDAGGLIHLFHLDNADSNLDLSGVTLTGGSGDVMYGGGLYMSNGTAVLDRVAVTDNQADNGGGVKVSGGNLTITNSTLSGNSANTTDGGGIYVATTGSVSITNSTISGNTAVRHGGGIYHGGTGILNISNSTIADNTADSNSDDNGDGGGIYRGNGTVNIKSTIVADNTDATTLPALDHGAFEVDLPPPAINPDISGSITSQDYNHVEDATGLTWATGAGANDVTGSDPALAALADNGGPTQTHALGPDSPAFGTGNAIAIGGAPVTTDQRGVPRDDSPDKGAYEYSAAADALFDFLSSGGCFINDLMD